MKSIIIVLMLLLPASQVMGQKHNKKVKDSSVPIKIQWVDSLEGDFSFTEKWSYLFGIGIKEDGTVGCIDDGCFPSRCYDMMDSNLNVIKDSIKIFYQLIDTTHIVYSITCDSCSSEWMKDDTLHVVKISNDTIVCSTIFRCRIFYKLNINIVKDFLYPTIKSKMSGHFGGNTYQSMGGYIKIDKRLWEQGIMKAEFKFNFKNQDAKNPMFWKGKIYSSIK